MARIAFGAPRLSSFVARLLACLLLAVPSVSFAAPDAIVVSSKIDTEGALLGNIIAVLLTKSGLTVEDKIGLGPTAILRAAILTGQVDIYPEYTGNGAFFFHRERDQAWKDSAASYERVRTLDRDANKLVWLTPAPADNSWSIAVRKDLAGAQNIASIDDLVRYVQSGGRLKLAASIEFIDGPAALPSFEESYGFHLSQSQLLALAGGNTAATIRAAAEHTSGVNAAMAYGTDGALAALGLVLLSDNRHTQIVYNPAPVIRGTVLERHPEIATILAPVFRSLSLETLQRLNAKIAVNGENARSVAVDYLVQNGFIAAAR